MSFTQGGDFLPNIDFHEIAQQVDAVAYISQYCELETSAGGRFLCRCPFHEERTPSFVVYPENNSFYCFGCGAGGDIIDFVQRYHRCSNFSAAQKLMEYAGIEGGIRPTGRLEAVKVMKAFRAPPKQKSVAAVSFLPEDYMETMYVEAHEKFAVWEAEGISTESLARFQVRFDPVANRLVYPVRDMQGNILNVCGRTLDLDFKEKRIPKYIYSRHIGSLQTIYGFFENEDFIRKTNQLILFEGAKSVMLADTWGVKNTGAILTSHLSDWQMRELIRLQIPVVFALDKEVAASADKHIRKLSRFVRVEIIADSGNLLQPKMAPVDAGLEIWQKLYAGRIQI